jgi:hypothetical protein
MLGELIYLIDLSNKVKRFFRDFFPVEVLSSGLLSVLRSGLLDPPELGGREAGILFKGGIEY